MIKAILIDDETHCLDTLSILLKEHCSGVKVMAQCKSAAQALDAIDKFQPALIFLDIEMSGLSGLDFYKSLQHAPQVIFTTAYPQYALQGFDVNALDYLVKPISFDRFVKAALKAKEYFEVRTKQFPDEIKNDDASFFYVKTGNRQGRGYQAGKKSQYLSG